MCFVLHEIVLQKSREPDRVNKAKNATLFRCVVLDKRKEATFYVQVL
jgi:hypothetical protein